MESWQGQEDCEDDGDEWEHATFLRSEDFFRETQARCPEPDRPSTQPDSKTCAQHVNVGDYLSPHTLGSEGSEHFPTLWGDVVEEDPEPDTRVPQCTTVSNEEHSLFSARSFSGPDPTDWLHASKVEELIGVPQVLGGASGEKQSSGERGHGVVDCLARTQLMAVPLQVPVGLNLQGDRRYARIIGSSDSAGGADPSRGVQVWQYSRAGFELLTRYAREVPQILDAALASAQEVEQGAPLSQYLRRVPGNVVQAAHAWRVQNLPAHLLELDNRPAISHSANVIGGKKPYGRDNGDGLRQGSTWRSQPENAAWDRSNTGAPRRGATPLRATSQAADRPRSTQSPKKRQQNSPRGSPQSSPHRRQAAPGAPAGAGSKVKTAPALKAKDLEPLRRVVPAPPPSIPAWGGVAVAQLPGPLRGAGTSRVEAAAAGSAVSLRAILQEEQRQREQGDAAAEAPPALEEAEGVIGAAQGTPRSATGLTSAPSASASESGPAAGRSRQSGGLAVAEAAAAPPCASETLATPSGWAGMLRASLGSQADSVLKAAPIARAPALEMGTKEFAAKEARKSKVDKFGKVKCLACSKVFPLYSALEQHLLIKHGGLNSPDAKLLAMATAAQQQQPAQASGKRQNMQLADLFESLPSAAPPRAPPTAQGAAWPSLAGPKAAPRPSAWGLPAPAPGVASAWPSPGRPDLSTKKAVETDRRTAAKQPQPGPTKISAGMLGLSAFIKEAKVKGADQTKRSRDGRIKAGGELMVNPNKASSTAVQLRHGKEREEKKRKKVSRLKKIILKEREDKTSSKLPEAGVEGGSDAESRGERGEEAGGDQEDAVRPADAERAECAEQTPEEMVEASGDAGPNLLDEAGVLGGSACPAGPELVEHDDAAPARQDSGTDDAPCAAEDDADTLEHKAKGARIGADGYSGTHSVLVPSGGTFDPSRPLEVVASLMEVGGHVHVSLAVVHGAIVSGDETASSEAVPADEKAAGQQEMRGAQGGVQPEEMSRAVCTAQPGTSAVAAASGRAQDDLSNVPEEQQAPGMDLPRLLFAVGGVKASALELAASAEWGAAPSGEAAAAAFPALLSSPMSSSGNTVGTGAAAPMWGLGTGTALCWKSILIGPPQKEGGEEESPAKEESANLLIQRKKKKKGKSGADDPLEDASPEPATATSKPKPKEKSVPVRCELCDKECTSQAAYVEHLVGRKHKAREARVDQPPPPAPKPKVVPHTYMGTGVEIRYANQVISKELNDTVTALLQELHRFQERAIAKDPTKAKMKKRFVFGLREVAKAVATNKARCVIVAPNVEHIEAEGGLDDLLGDILKEARDASLQIIFALTRSRLGQVIGRRVRMSVAAVLEYNGADDLYKHMLRLADEGRQEWAKHHQEQAEKAKAEAKAAEAKAAAELVTMRARRDGTLVPVHDMPSTSAAGLPGADSSLGLSQGASPDSQEEPQGAPGEDAEDNSHVDTAEDVRKADEARLDTQRPLQGTLNVKAPAFVPLFSATA
ncbi:hypothetical protein CYMTET_13286 [Cymbomonas tetramitiformis]|uniref:C2H2-type domain-containing protein n=1 Tax=Cymbomonas tetramitiformis TaxID=36881 RepID=A0AAE0GIZ9_9CHLO|nr:hypothetical protein CYMTET_13286 [Cymbomonas tetramitiformis]